MTNLNIGTYFILTLIWFAFMTPVHADELANDVITELGLIESDRPVRQNARWREPQRILLSRLTPSQVASLQQNAPDVEFISVRSNEEAMEYIATADALIGMCSADLIKAGAELRWVHVLSAGVDYCGFTSEIDERNILVTNMQKVAGGQIAEHVMAMLLSLSRGLQHYADQQSLENWDQPPFGSGIGWELRGRTLLVVGLGGIGTAVAELSHAFDMHVIAIRNSSREGPDFIDYVGLSDELSTLASQADVVVNALPLTPSTEGLFDYAFFSTMNEGAVFINVGRGKSVVTSDLVQALEDGKIAGAGLDVVDPAPLPKGHPLWSAPNVVITPHVASSSDQNEARYSIVLGELIRRYVAGDRVFSVVNVGKGY